MRLIDADALKAMRFSMYSNFLGKVSVVAVKDVDDAPSIDAVPVVRCAECEKRDKSFTSENGTVCCPYMEAFMSKDDFCSYGERKDGEDDATN